MATITRRITAKGRQAFASSLSGITAGSVLLLDSELVRVDAIHAAGGTMTLTRGVDGTLPAAHASGITIIAAMPLAVAVAAGAPSDAPVGTLPLYLNSSSAFGLYIWTGSAWKGPYAVAT